MMNVQKPIWVMTLVDSRYRFILRLCLFLSRQKIITGNFSRLHPNHSGTVTTAIAANRIEPGEKFICWMRTQLLLTIFLIVNFSILIKQPRRPSEQTKHVFVQFDIAYRSVRSFIYLFVHSRSPFISGRFEHAIFFTSVSIGMIEEKQQPLLLLQVGRCTLNDISIEHSWRPE